jgi:translation initiation factor 5B
MKSFQYIELGRIVSIEKNHKSLEIAQKDSEVCIKIAPITGEMPKMYGRHFDDNDLLISKVCTSNSTIAYENK